MSGIEVSEEEYYDKKLEIARNLLPAMVAKVTEEYLQDKRKRASLLYNCVAISGDLLTEMGITMEQPPKLLGGDNPRTTIKNPNIQDRRTPQSPVERPAAHADQTSTDIGNRTAIRKLSEMLPSGK